MKKNLEKIFIGAKITKIKRICNLVAFTFTLKDKKEMFLHVTCFLRIFDKDENLVICTQNMLDRSPNSKKKKFDWTEIGSTIFDDAVQDYQNQIFEAKISNFIFDKKDIKIIFENGMKLDVLITATKYDDEQYSENYRIFEKDKNKPHFVV